MVDRKRVYSSRCRLRSARMCHTCGGSICSAPDSVNGGRCNRFKQCALSVLAVLSGRFGRLTFSELYRLGAAALVEEARILAIFRAATVTGHPAALVVHGG